MAVSVLRLKIRLFDSSAEGQQVAVGLDLLAELIGGEACGQDCKEVTKHQGVQFGRPSRVSNNVCVLELLDQYTQWYEKSASTFYICTEDEIQQIILGKLLKHDITHAACNVSIKAVYRIYKSTFTLFTENPPKIVPDEDLILKSFAE